MRPRRFPREEEATLVEHLEELRGRILVALAAVAMATAVAFVFHNRILEWLARPLPPAHRHLAAFGVTEPFSGSSSPVRMRIKVDFPAPLGPVIA